MIDHATIKNLAELRRQINEAEIACGQTLGGLSRAGRGAQAAATTPFLAACARDLEALAGRMRLAAAEVGAPRGA